MTTRTDQDIEWVWEKVKALQEIIEKSGLEIEKLKKTLRHIQSMAGNPDPVEGCRSIIKKAEDALDGKDIAF
ncbi:MAG TPA: hypothetical protein VJ112_01390 [Rhabdochlamydiaceae bacterium]|nr:hypothetical protein [Rhabdochlamydiaceae bacterium]